MSNLNLSDLDWSVPLASREQGDSETRLDLGPFYYSGTIYVPPIDPETKLRTDTVSHCRVAPVQGTSE